MQESSVGHSWDAWGTAWSAGIHRVVLEPHDVATDKHAIQHVNDAKEWLVACSEAYRDPAIVWRAVEATLLGLSTRLEVRLHLHAHRLWWWVSHSVL